MIKIIFPQCLINMGLQFFVGIFIINKYGKMIFICCVHFLQISMCCQRGVPIWFTWGPICILYLYDQMWLDWVFEMVDVLFERVRILEYFVYYRKNRKNYQFPDKDV